MPFALPDPSVAARREADHIHTHAGEVLDEPLVRVLADSPGVDKTELLRGIEEFHSQRMSRIPSLASYPESGAWVDYVLSVDRQVAQLAGLSDRQMALHRSLNDFLAFRGFARAADARIERCRVAFVPDTDRGVMHIKNIDDPATYWRKSPPVTHFNPRALVWDGVGSGLHIDDEPSEIFPLPIYSMCMATCNDVPGAVEFLTRYSQFWGRANVVLFDPQNRSVAIEKCSFTNIQVYHPGPTGRSHVSGMACRDPKSKIAIHQQAKRDEYRRRFNVPDDSPDVAFWNLSDEQERRLSKLLNSPGPILASDILELFATPSPAGLAKNGDKFHPDQGIIEYTLATSAKFLDEKTVVRWQRDDKDLSWPTEPEIYRF